MSQSPVKCALLAWSRFEWLCEACLHCPGLEVGALDRGLVGLSGEHNPPLGRAGEHNPYGLPTVRQPEVMLVSTAWCEWLVRCHPARVEEVFSRLEGCAEVIVGIESHDELQLNVAPEALERMACVLKGGGVYRDRDLYNHEVGPRFTGGMWSERRRPRQRRRAYTPEDLEKLRMSIPCFLWVVPGARRRLRALREDLSPAGRLTRDTAERLLTPVLDVGARVDRPQDVHCVGRLTHIQRLEAVRMLEGLEGHQGITEVPERVSGLAGAEPYWHGKPLPPRVQQELEAAAQPYMRASMSRLAFQLDLRRHKVVVAVTGHGELTYRHMEALAAGAVLVCQDLSHAETMFPFADRENVLFCRSDLSDLRSTVEEALGDERLRRRVGETGRRTYIEWARCWREHLLEGIELPIRAAFEAEARPVTGVGTHSGGEGNRGALTGSNID